jgi:excisionase family DNA binding protein
MKAVLTVLEASYYTTIPAKTIYDLIRDRKIPYRKQGTRIVFLLDELDQWLHALPGLPVKELIEAEKSRHIPAVPQSHPETPVAPSPSTAALVRGPEGPKMRRPQAAD